MKTGLRQFVKMRPSWEPSESLHQKIFWLSTICETAGFNLSFLQRPFTLVPAILPTPSTTNLETLTFSRSVSVHSKQLRAKNCSLRCFTSYSTCTQPEKDPTIPTLCIQCDSQFSTHAKTPSNTLNSNAHVSYVPPCQMPFEILIILHLHVVYQLFLILKRTQTRLSSMVYLSESHIDYAWLYSAFPNN